MAKEHSTRATDANTLFGPILELQKAGFGNLAGQNVAWLEGLGDMGAEFMNFLAERVKEDVKTQHELLHCKDVAEVQKIQSQFIQTAINQYQAETGKLMQMGMSTFKAKDEEAS